MRKERLGAANIVVWLMGLLLTLTALIGFFIPAFHPIYRSSDIDAILVYVCFAFVAPCVGVIILCLMIEQKRFGVFFQIVSVMALGYFILSLPLWIMALQR